MIDDHPVGRRLASADFLQCFGGILSPMRAEPCRMIESGAISLIWWPAWRNWQYRGVEAPFSDGADQVARMVPADEAAGCPPLP